MATTRRLLVVPSAHDLIQDASAYLATVYPPGYRRAAFTYVVDAGMFCSYTINTMPHIDDGTRACDPAYLDSDCNHVMTHEQYQHARVTSPAVLKNREVVFVGGEVAKL